MLKQSGGKSEKKSFGNAVGKWDKRWFVLRGGNTVLCYYKVRLATRVCVCVRASLSRHTAAEVEHGLPPASPLTILAASLCLVRRLSGMLRRARSRLAASTAVAHPSSV